MKTPALAVKVSLEDTIKDKVPEIVRALKKAKGSYVTVGWQDSDVYPDTNLLVAQVAIFNEYGTESRKGNVKTPARPFIRPAYDENIEKVTKIMADAMDGVAYRGKTVEWGLTKVGFNFAQLIRKKILSNVPPPNAPYTLERKAEAQILNPQTLVFTGQMRDHVTFAVTLADGQREEPKPIVKAGSGAKKRTGKPRSDGKK